MLSEVSNTVPSAEELSAVSDAINAATTPAELLSMSLERAAGLREPSRADVHVSAAQAWHLTMFARDIRSDAERLVEYAKTIEEAAVALYLDQPVPPPERAFGEQARWRAAAVLERRADELTSPLASTRGD